MVKRKLSLLIAVVLLCLSHHTIKAQTPNEEIVRVNTRVVSVDVLVQDRQNRQPVLDLPLEAFHIFDNGRERQLTYFGREGLRRQPLAVVLTFDLSTGAILYLARRDVAEEIIGGLDKLQISDEVEVRQNWYEPDPRDRLSFELRSKVVSPLTPDRSRTAEAIRTVQQFAARNLRQVKLLFSFTELYKGTWKQEIWSGVKGAAGIPFDPPIKMTTATDFEYIIDKAPLLAQQRPDSLLALVNITDDLGAERTGDSTQHAERLIASGVMVNGVVVQKNLMAHGVDVTGRVLSPALGARFHTISYYSEETGGQVTTAKKPNEFAAALSSVIAGLAARYSVGFRLTDADREDGIIHKLTVKVSALDARARERELIVRARRGYYVPPEQKAAR
jgi:VWFA-related protein